MSVNNIGAKSALTVGALAAAALVAVGVLGMHSVAPLSGMSRGLKVALIAIGSTAGVLIVLSAPKAICASIKRESDAGINYTTYVKKSYYDGMDEFQSFCMSLGPPAMSLVEV